MDTLPSFESFIEQKGIMKKKYKCSNCKGQGIEYKQPYGIAFRCSSCYGSGEANELDSYAQRTKGEQNRV